MQQANGHKFSAINTRMDQMQEAIVTNTDNTQTVMKQQQAQSGTLTRIEQVLQALSLSKLSDTPSPATNAYGAATGTAAVSSTAGQPY